jgi:hypothetical protein
MKKSGCVELTLTTDFRAKSDFLIFSRSSEVFRYCEKEIETPLDG